MNLDRLGSVDWAHLTSRQGPDSSMIPGYLQNLASGDASLQDEAFVSLLVTLLHDTDHAVFAATPSAVPFLREIAAAPGLGGRNLALVLLREIATFQGDAYLLEGIRRTDLRDDADRFPFDTSIVAVMAGYMDYLRIAVSDTDAAARCVAAQLVGILVTSVDPREALRDAVARDGEERARAGLALALGLQLRARGDRDVAVLEPLLEGGEAWLMPAAAIAIGLAEGDAISESHLEKLEAVEGMERTKDFDFWNKGLLGVYASKILPPI